MMDEAAAETVGQTLAVMHCGPKPGICRHRDKHVQPWSEMAQVAQMARLPAGLVPGARLIYVPLLSKGCGL